jgi:carboxymethylenebutenolidase
MADSKRAGVSLNQLSRIQLYMGQELIERYEAGLLSWRKMLRGLILVGGSAAAAAAFLAASSGPDSGASPGFKLPPGFPEIKMQPPTGPLVVKEGDPALETGMVTFSSDTEVRGYLARPKASQSGETYPGVIVIHEMNGMSDHIKDVARRVAKAGYIALAPDLVSRWGGTGDLSFEQVVGLLANAKPAELLKDLDAGVAFLEQQPGIKAGKIGVVGFCFGGGYTLNLAAHNPKIQAAVCYYGVTPQPAEQMANTNAAILSHYASTDQRVNATVPELERVLQEHGKTFVKHVHEGVVHAFNNDTVANFFNEAAAVTAWGETLAWFDKYLKS